MKIQLGNSARTFVVAIAAPTVALAMLAGCDIDKTQDGKMPSVDVDVKAGALPKYEVDVAEVKAGLKTETIMVPEVKMVEKEIKVPTVGIEMPDNDKPK